MKSILKERLNSLEEAHERESICANRLIKELEKSIDFKPINIFYQPSDGYVIEHDGKNAPLSWCINIIIEEGWLSFDDYIRLCI
jgi:hypothetical protein